jgi:hypothetical protein
LRFALRQFFEGAFFRCGFRREPIAELWHVLKPISEMFFIQNFGNAVSPAAIPFKDGDPEPVNLCGVIARVGFF